VDYSSWLLENEQSLRLGFFLSGFFGFLAVGFVFPYRSYTLQASSKRWLNNSLLTLANSFLLKLLMPFTVVWVAQNYSSYGLLKYLGGSNVILFFLGIVVLDFAVYWQHRLFHVVPLFWRLHRVHHTDVEFDVTTALRFHTVEIFLSYFVKTIIIVVFGISFESVIVFEITLNFCAMFNHGNYQLPKGLERMTRYLLVTPSMHRVHHSVLQNETNSNYGFCLSLWDRLFGSYVHKSKNDPRVMKIGIDEFRSPEEQSIIHLLSQPLRKSGV